MLQAMPEGGGEVWETCGRGLATCGSGLVTCGHDLVTCAGTVGSDMGMCAGVGEGSDGEEVMCDGGRERHEKEVTLSSMSSDLGGQEEDLPSTASGFVSSLTLSSWAEGEECHCCSSPLDCGREREGESPTGRGEWEQ